MAADLTTVLTEVDLSSHPEFSNFDALTVETSLFLPLGTPDLRIIDMSSFQPAGGGGSVRPGEGFLYPRRED